MDIQNGQNLEELDASSEKVSNLTVNLPAGSLPLRKISTERQNNKHNPEARRDTAQKHVKDKSFSQKMIAENKAFVKRYNMVIVSNPSVCIYPNVVKHCIKIQTPESSDVGLQPRASYIKKGISKMTSDESCSRVILEESKNQKRRSSTNRQPCSWNCEAQQFQAKINQEDESVDNICDEEVSE